MHTFRPFCRSLLPGRPTGVAQAAWQLTAKRGKCSRAFNFFPDSHRIAFSISGTEVSFDTRWLIDNDRSPEGYDATSFQRTIDFADFGTQEPSTVEVNGTKVNIVWKNGKVTSYPKQWLEDCATSRVPEGAEFTDPAADFSNRVVWDREAFSKDRVQVPSAPLGEFKTPEGMLKWLCGVRDVGFGLVTGVEPTVEATREVAESIGGLQGTLYSPDMWMTEVRPDGNDTAYTSIPLKPHTDGNYLLNPPGMQVFHCLKPADKGGDTLLVDGLRVLEELKRNHAATYRYFSRYPIQYVFKDKGHHYITYKPVFTFNSKGEMVEFHFNNDDRGLQPAAPDVGEYYDHLENLLAVVKQEDLQHQLRLEPGTVIMIDNHRVLHGRTSFDPTSGRKLSGTYLSKEDFNSKLRVLANETLY